MKERKRTLWLVSEESSIESHVMFYFVMFISNINLRQEEREREREELKRRK